MWQEKVVHKYTVIYNTTLNVLVLQTVLLVYYPFQWKSFYGDNRYTKHETEANISINTGEGFRSVKTKTNILSVNRSEMLYDSLAKTHKPWALSMKHC